MKMRSKDRWKAIATAIRWCNNRCICSMKYLSLRTSKAAGWVPSQPQASSRPNPTKAHRNIEQRPLLPCPCRAKEIKRKHSRSKLKRIYRRNPLITWKLTTIQEYLHQESFSKKEWFNKRHYLLYNIKDVILSKLNSQIRSSPLNAKFTKRLKKALAADSQSSNNLNIAVNRKIVVVCLEVRRFLSRRNLPSKICVKWSEIRVSRFSWRLPQSLSTKTLTSEQLCLAMKVRELLSHLRRQHSLFYSRSSNNRVRRWSAWAMPDSQRVKMWPVSKPYRDQHRIEQSLVSYQSRTNLTLDWVPDRHQRKSL